MKFFKDNQASLFEKYPDKILVIVNDQVVDAFSDFFSAYHEAIKNYKPGQFMLQRCGKDSSAYTVTISSFQLV